MKLPSATHRHISVLGKAMQLRMFPGCAEKWQKLKLERNGASICRRPLNKAGVVGHQDRRPLNKADVVGHQEPWLRGGVMKGSSRISGTVYRFLLNEKRLK